MAGELRWILLGCSALLLIGIIAWGARRSRQAPGNAQLRESTSSHGPASTHAPASLDEPAMSARAAEVHGWGVPPFEPLSIRTAHFDQVPTLEAPMSAIPPPVGGDRSAETTELMTAHAAAPLVSAQSVRAAPPAAQAANLRSTAVISAAATRPAPSLPAAPAMPEPPATNASESQRIVTIRVAARSDALWGGSTLLAALEKHGLGFGRYKVFHRKHGDGRTLFCAASLVEPGTFDVAKMPEQEFRGLTLFAVLPGPLDAVEAVDLLVTTAGELAATLQGVVQDAEGAPLTTERALALRDDVARFQASLRLN